MLAQPFNKRVIVLMSLLSVRNFPTAWPSRSISRSMLPLHPNCSQSRSFRIPPIALSCRAHRRRLYSSESTYHPPKFLFRRSLKFSALAIFFTGAGFFIAVSPAISPAVALFLASSDAESLISYNPGDDFATKIDSYIQKHPLTESLRANPAYNESRPHLRLPETHRRHSLTSGSLLGPGRVPVPPLVFCEEGKKLFSISYLGSDLCGHIGVIHGGMLATMMDEGMARCCFAALPNKIGFTANLSVNYRAPAPASSYVVLKAEVVKAEGRKVWVKARIETLGEGIEPGKLLAEAEGLFIEPKYAKAMPKLLMAQS